MKPPVDAPTSRQTRSAGSISNASSAAASLWPPRLTYGSRSARAIGRVSGEQVARLQVRARGVALAHPDLAGEDRVPGPSSSSRRGRARRGAGPGAVGTPCRGRSASQSRSRPYRGTARFTADHRGRRAGPPHVNRTAACVDAPRVSALVGRSCAITAGAGHDLGLTDPTDARSPDRPAPGNPRPGRRRRAPRSVTRP